MGGAFWQEAKQLCYLKSSVPPVDDPGKGLGWDSCVMALLTRSGRELWPHSGPRRRRSAGELVRVAPGAERDPTFLRSHADVKSRIRIQLGLETRNLDGGPAFWRAGPTSPNLPRPTPTGDAGSGGLARASGGEGGGEGGGSAVRGFGGPGNLEGVAASFRGIATT